MGQLSVATNICKNHRERRAAASQDPQELVGAHRFVSTIRSGDR